MQYSRRMDEEWEQPSLEIEKSSYTIAEILEWRDAQRLMLSPSFQRGNVWSAAAKAYLIDTILRGYPIPPLHIRHVTTPDGRLVREVIDGQQRLTAVIEYMDGRFALARPRQSPDPLPPWAGNKFSDLVPEYVRRILEYSFRCEVYKGNVPDAVIYEIFSRINIHSVQLSSQELRNGRYFGDFKQAVYQLSKEHKEIWKALGLFSSQGLARMRDAEFVSEALIVQIDGMQDKKNSIDQFYRRYDEDWPDRAVQEALFRQTMDTIRGVFGELISNTRFKRVPLFYSLYCVVFHHTAGIPAQVVPPGADPLPISPRRPLSGVDIGRLRGAILTLASALEGDRAEEGEGEGLFDEEDDLEVEMPAAVRTFLNATSSQTDNIRPRLDRFTAIWELADF